MAALQTEPVPIAPATKRRARTRHTANGPRSIIARIAVYLLLGALALGVIYPLLWMVLSGFKTNAEMFGDAWGLPSAVRWENYTTALDQGVLDYFVNSAIVTILSIIGVVFLSAWAAYGLTRLKIPFAGAITLLILGGMMLAPTVALVPLFQLLQTFGLYDTRWALVILYIAYRIPFSLFLIRAYMLTLPHEMEEAGVIDGANSWQIFRHIVLPLCRPVLVSAAVLQALFAWNEFPFALVFVSDSALKTLPVGLLDMKSALTTNWPVLFAGLTIAAVPMIITFFIGQRHFIRGLSDGFGK
jgi:raffinose/stachyose/melibiose transport system permease protein